MAETIDDTPDLPVSFGYKMSWLAVRSLDAESVLRSLNLERLERANWQTGVTAAYNGRTFVSPVVEGWVFVLSRNLPELGYKPQAGEWTSLMQSLSQQFGEAQYFATHRVVGLCNWALFQEGKEVRTFSYLGERGEFSIVRGGRTAGELELGYEYLNIAPSLIGLDAYDLPDDVRLPDEDHVMEVAGKWSVNPNQLEDRERAVGVGWVGEFCGSGKVARTN